MPLTSDEFIEAWRLISMPA